MSRKQIKVNENLTSLFNFIQECETTVSWADLVQFALDYKMYEELYLNAHILQKLIDDHDSKIRSGEWVKPK